MQAAPGTSSWLAAPLSTTIRRYGSGTLPSLLLATLLVTLLALALPIALLQVYDRILPQASLGTLGLLTAAVTAAVMLELALRVIRGEVLGRLAAAAEAKLQAEAALRIASTRSAAFEAHGNGWYSERLAAIGSLREAWSGPMLQTLLDLPFALLYLLAVAAISGPLALVPLSMLGCVLVLGLLVGWRVRRRAERLTQSEERRFNFLFDVLHSLSSLKLMGAERLLERRYDRLQGGSARLRRELAEASAAGQEGGLLLSYLTTLGTASWGCLMVLDQQLTVGGLSACTMLAGRSMQPLLGGIALWVRWQMLRDAKRRVAELATLPIEAQLERPPLAVPEGRISLQEVRCGRQLGGWLFDGLSLEVAPGEFVGITGPNGSGRSTLLRMVTGESQPVKGQVLVDGQDLSQVNVVPARCHVALVPPDPALIGGTLLDNLTLNQPTLEGRALSLGAALGLETVAAALPGGWQTPVGIGGSPLARGVVQRIGLVRALVQDPRILLLDDVTAQLDADGDARLGRLLVGLRGRTTILLVSHRRSVLTLADRVLRITNGRLEPGP